MKKEGKKKKKKEVHECIQNVRTVPAERGTENGAIINHHLVLGLLWNNIKKKCSWWATSIHKSKKEKPKELTKSKEGKQQYLNACKIQRTLSPRCGPSTFQLFVID